MSSVFVLFSDIDFSLRQDGVSHFFSFLPHPFHFSMVVFPVLSFSPFTDSSPTSYPKITLSKVPDSCVCVSLNSQISHTPSSNDSNSSTCQKYERLSSKFRSNLLFLYPWQQRKRKKFPKFFPSPSLVDVWSQFCDRWEAASMRRVFFIFAKLGRRRFRIQEEWKFHIDKKCSPKQKEWDFRSTFDISRILIQLRFLPDTGSKMVIFCAFHFQGCFVSEYWSSRVGKEGGKVWIISRTRLFNSHQHHYIFGTLVQWKRSQIQAKKKIFIFSLRFFLPKKIFTHNVRE